MVGIPISRDPSIEGSLKIDWHYIFEFFLGISVALTGHHWMEASIFFFNLFKLFLVGKSVISGEKLFTRGI